MMAAFRIEKRFAIRTFTTARKVLFNRQLGFTHTAKNGFGIERLFRPHFCCMASFFFMAEVAGIILATTFKFDGNNIQR